MGRTHRGIFFHSCVLKTNAFTGLTLKEECGSWLPCRGSLLHKPLAAPSLLRTLDQVNIALMGECRRGG